ncbi:leucyl/phenylalanyl-tRNA--protein transferase [Celerinatantimonas sp. YJH-8]|uniref:leucyl/phenylalanyl-tRNA--protein transferase n=1 Tax=Celerinatantimonas sp. YJH-8 TaxID=3228714 RepID=UPI0038C8C2A5
MQLHVLNHTLNFPDINSALDHPDGLLAIGGDLNPDRLIRAYYHGIFPWFSEEDPLLWWSPGTRAILDPKRLHISHSMRKWLKKTTFHVTVNNAFTDIIRHCATRPNHEGTWITNEMIMAYCKLHQMGYAHSVEVWEQQQLVGGLYGICIGQLFCGESMFHLQTNASKLAFIRLVQHFSAHGGQLIDAQMPTEHLMSMGVQPCSRNHFKSCLEQLRDRSIAKNCWDPQTL